MKEEEVEVEVEVAHLDEVTGCLHEFDRPRDESPPTLSKTNRQRNTPVISWLFQLLNNLMIHKNKNPLVGALHST